VPDEFEQEQDPVSRSFWSGTITFGLVSIPVALYAANRSNRVSLRMVSPEGTPLNRRYFTSKDDRELDADEIVRGYETEKGKFVIVDDEELERLAPERTRDIDLRQFVDASEIDPMYFERAYYLIPNGQSTKAYRLLARVMEETGRAGVATFVMRAKEYLVAILAENGILRAETLRFADELRTPETVGLPEPVKPDAAAVRRMDREIGKRLDDSLDKKDLVDHSADRLLKLVKGKVRAGDDVVHPEERETDGDSDIIDLMEILKRRLQGEREEAADTASSSADDEDDDAPRPARKTAAKKATAKKAPAKKTGSKTAAKKTAAKTTASRTATARKPAAKKAASKTSASKKSAAKKATSKKPASKGATSKKAA
jgi:DNA end-binding protein Ku